MKDLARKYLTVLLAAVFLISTALLVSSTLDKKKANETYQQAQQIAGLNGNGTVREETKPAAETEFIAEETEPVQETVPVETEPRTVWVPAAVEEDDYMKNLASTDLDALREINPDVVGWIFLPNSQVNYPIVQGEDNQYYLEHTWNNQKSIAGSIFLEASNAPDFSDFRSILYGHNMANMSMFAILHNYTSEYYINSYPYVYLVTDEGVLRYEIYSSYKAAVDSKTYAIELDERMKASFIRMTVEESEVDVGIVPAETDRILTLSTCTGNYDTRRVVHARLVMEEVIIISEEIGKNDSPQG